MERKNLLDHKNQTIARMKVKGSAFEILVDTAKAVEYRKSKKGNLAEIVIFDGVFRDYKKGIRASGDELELSFGTTNAYDIAKKMILEGELMLPMEHKAKAREEKTKQIVDWLARSCVNPQNGLPHPPDRIMRAMEEAGAKVDETKPMEQQAMAIMRLIQKILSIKIEAKKIMLKIPAMHASKSYGVVKGFIIKEEWLSDGSLSATVEVPQAALMDFYAKLNAVTHGAAYAKEI